MEQFTDDDLIDFSLCIGDRIRDIRMWHRKGITTPSDDHQLARLKALHEKVLRARVQLVHEVQDAQG